MVVSASKHICTNCISVGREDRERKRTWFIVKRAGGAWPDEKANEPLPSDQLRALAIFEFLCLRPSGDFGDSIEGALKEPIIIISVYKCASSRIMCTYNGNSYSKEMGQGREFCLPNTELLLGAPGFQVFNPSFMYIQSILHVLWKQEKENLLRYYQCICKPH